MIEHPIQTVVFVTIAAVIYLIETFWLGIRWRKREYPRWVLGVSTMLILSFIWVYVGGFNFHTVFTMGLGFVVGGLIKGLRLVEEDNKQEIKRRERWKALRLEENATTDTE